LTAAQGLDHDTARAAVALANRAPSVHNSQPWRWRIAPSSIHLFADPSRALPATDPDGRDMRLSCGAALHHLRVALLAAGWRARVHRLPDPAHPRHLAAVEVEPAQPTPSDLGLARSLEHRRTDRRVFSTWPVPAAFLDELASAAAAEGAVLHRVYREADRRALVELVERAAVEQALTPDLAQETAAWTGRSRGAQDGVPAANVPDRPEGTIPVRHFAAGSQDQNELGRDESDGTVLAVLATEGDGAEDQLRAGEALSAVLLLATRMGLATDPVTQPLEVPSTRARLQALIPDDGGQPQVVLRLGWAPVSATEVPATGRRPVDQTIDAMDAPWD
jgi:nitroreductase